MAEFKVVLDGLELTDDQTAEVSQAVLKSAVETIGRFRTPREEVGHHATFTVPIQGKLLGDGIINGGEILRGVRALELQRHLFENGPLAGELGVQFRR